MSFSTGLRITDLDDFITPAQECIKPVKIEKSDRKTSKIIIGDDGSYTGVTEIGEKYKLEKVEITLNDCLACSGCVTSAETVLINEQSTDEFLKKIISIKENNDNTLIIMSISPQSKASLSSKFNLGNIYQTNQKLNHFFRSLNVDIVLDTDFGRQFSLLETAINLKQRLCTKTKNSPLIASSCPGWVCYAEKHKENETLVPLISKSKSPQQMMGYLVKCYLKEFFSQYRDTKIFHVSIMPCFDKKLEASRDEFSFVNNIETGVKEREVDIVLSSAEIEKIIEEKGYNFDIPFPDENHTHEIENMFSCKYSLDTEGDFTEEETGSGGYLEYSLRYCAKEVFGLNLLPDLKKDPHIRIKMLRNCDFKEVSLFANADDAKEQQQPLMTLAYTYGFRNIQTVVQRIRQKKCNYQFIEVMACPGGCLNGGGQIRSDDKGIQKQILQNVTDVYRSYGSNGHRMDEKVCHIYDRLESRGALTTTYNIVPKFDIINPASFKW